MLIKPCTYFYERYPATCKALRLVLVYLSLCCIFLKQYCNLALFEIFCQNLSLDKSLGLGLGLGIVHYRRELKEYEISNLGVGLINRVRNKSNVKALQCDVCVKSRRCLIFFGCDISY